MREQIPELTRKDMKELIPRRLLGELDEEAARLKEELLEKIHYSKEIRLAYEPAGCMLSHLASDEEARLLFTNRRSQTWSFSSRLTSRCSIIRMISRHYLLCSRANVFVGWSQTSVGPQY